MQAAAADSVIALQRNIVANKCHYPMQPVTTGFKSLKWIVEVCEAVLLRLVAALLAVLLLTRRPGTKLSCQ